MPVVFTIQRVGLTCDPHDALLGPIAERICLPDDASFSDDSTIPGQAGNVAEKVSRNRFAHCGRISPREKQIMRIRKYYHSVDICAQKFHARLGVTEDPTLWEIDLFWNGLNAASSGHVRSNMALAMRRLEQEFAEFSASFVPTLSHHWHPAPEQSPMTSCVLRHRPVHALKNKNNKNLKFMGTMTW